MNRQIEQIHTNFVQALMDTKNPQDRISRRFLRYYIERELTKNNLSVQLCHSSDISKLTTLVKATLGSSFMFQGITHNRIKGDQFLGIRLPARMQQIYQSFRNNPNKGKSNRSRSKSRQTKRSPSKSSSQEQQITVHYQERQEETQNQQEDNLSQKSQMKWCSTKINKTLQAVKEARKLGQSCNRYINKIYKPNRQIQSRQEILQKRLKGLKQENKELKAVHSNLFKSIRQLTHKQKNILRVFQQQQ